MKYIKNILYLLGVLLAIGAVMIGFSSIILLMIEGILRRIGISVNNDWLFSISGELSAAITGSVTAFYVQKKHYTDWIKEKKVFHFKTCAYYCAAAVLLHWIFCAVTTLVCVNIFSMTEGIHIITQKSWADFLLMDFFFPVLAAPIFEELLFRMGLYSLIRRRLGENVSILLCSVIFAISHGYTLEGFISCLTVGLVFMLIYIHTGNLWYSIAAHGVGNLSICMMNALEDWGITLMGIPFQYEISGFNMVHPVLLFMAAGFWGIWLLKKIKTQKINVF